MRGRSTILLLLGVVLIITSNILNSFDHTESKSVQNKIDFEVVEYKDVVKDEEELYTKNVVEENGEDMVVEIENEIEVDEEESIDLLQNEEDPSNSTGLPQPSSIQSSSANNPNNPIPPVVDPKSTLSNPQQQQHYNFTQIVQQYNLAKVFRPHFALDDHFISHSYAWCKPQPRKKRSGRMDNDVKGILYNKVPKTASTTTAEVTQRIARACYYRKLKSKGHLPPQEQQQDSGDIDTTTNKKMTNQTMIEYPVSYFAVDHPSKTSKLFMSERNIYKSFLFGSIRDPAKRAISRFFFTKISKLHQLYPTDKNLDDKMLKFLQTDDNGQFGAISKGRGGFQTQYLLLRPVEQNIAYEDMDPTKALNQTKIIELVQRIMIDYDFMVLVERLDECLVLIQLMLGLETSDILYLSSKVSGSYFLERSKDDDDLGHCVKLEKSFVPTPVAEYLSSNQWYTDSFADYLLIEALDQSLDLTIDVAIGRERFQDALDRFHSMREETEKICGPKAIFPCSVDGENQYELSKENCYKKDEGCGHKCIDAL